MDFHASNPGRLVETVFQRIHVERMAAVPMLNPALEVAAIDFSRHEGEGGEWRGVLLTPWVISLMLLPAGPDWSAPPSHERVFREYPSGTFAFLGNHEEGLGNYLVCPLVHDMSGFADQTAAVQTARACLVALDIAPGQGAPVPASAPTPAPGLPQSASRRRFFGLGRG